MRRNIARGPTGLIMALFGLISVTTQVLEPTALAHPPDTTPSWTFTGTLNTGRSGHTATVLTNGKVLVVGGVTTGDFLDTAELYDPATGTWSTAGRLRAGRYLHTATLLPNGKVLVSGGISSTAPPEFGVTTSSELYDPATGTWSATGNLNTARFWYTATLVANGKVLVVGGAHNPLVLDSAELYDPATGAWTVTGNLNAARYGHTATLLQNGKVLVTGGSDDGDLSSTLASAELYDPAMGTWSNAANLNRSRALHTATLLPDGKVLVAGGYDSPPVSLNRAELFDPATGTWSNTRNLIAARDSHTATLLPNGQVLVAGGDDWNAPSRPATLNSAELYEPATGVWSNTAQINTARYSHTVALLQNGKVLVAGGFNNTNGTLNSAELYNPAITSTANPIDDARFFVRQHYLDFLNREPDPPGYAAWQAVIDDCPPGDISCDRIHVSSAFFRSPEFQERGYFVYRFYPVSFGRKPDYDEFRPDIAKVSGFVSDAELEVAKVEFVNEFMMRPAFIAKFSELDNAQYVNTLLSTAGITHPARALWIAALGNGTRTRAQVLREIAESAEAYDQYYNQAFVVMQYFGYLRRQPDALYLNWIAHLDSTGDYRSMINGFMNSLEYRARFGP
ncbi:MAG: kelch repeat-containing protein [Acidobacteriota bacterium]